MIISVVGKERTGMSYCALWTLTKYRRYVECQNLQTRKLVFRI